MRHPTYGDIDNRTYQLFPSEPAARLVTTAGAVPLDAEGNLVGPGDRFAQARQTLENLALALEAIGATARDVIKTTVYVVADDRADLAVVWRAVQESGMADMASTLLGVSLLGYGGQLVEIEAIAVLEKPLGWRRGPGNVREHFF